MSFAFTLRTPSAISSKAKSKKRKLQWVAFSTLSSEFWRNQFKAKMNRVKVVTARTKPAKSVLLKFLSQDNPNKRSNTPARTTINR
jgi:hypothetical protein